MAADAAIFLESVFFRYFESESGLTNVNLRINPGDCVLLLGRNGSGKSTLLSVIGGRRKVLEGAVRVLGRDAFDDTTLNADVSLIGPPWPQEAFFATTVQGVTTPCSHDERRQEIARMIHLPLGSFIDKMSAGEKRRVQILFGLMNPTTVMLLDECSTEIDVVERMTVLSFVKEQCRKRRCCCVYATHIFDGLSEWATHVALMDNGRLVSMTATSNIPDISSFAYQFLSRKSVVQFPATSVSDVKPSPIVVCRSLTYKHVFYELSFEVLRGSRTLLVGCNGTGKSTLLYLLSGKKFFANSKNELTIFDRPCFHDLSLDRTVAFCGDWWVKLPPGELHVREMLPVPLSHRAEIIRSMLSIDLDWDLRCVSSGELKRIQLLLHLQYEREVILLDEATSDLDLDQRGALLEFLYKESMERGVTVLYATHIFEGLGMWPSDCIVLSSTKKGVDRHFSAPVDYKHLIKVLTDLKQSEVWDTEKIEI